MATHAPDGAALCLESHSLTVALSLQCVFCVWSQDSWAVDIALLHFWSQLASVHIALSDWFVFLEANGFIVESGISSSYETGRGSRVFVCR